MKNENALTTSLAVPEFGGPGAKLFATAGLRAGGPAEPLAPIGGLAPVDLRSDQTDSTTPAIFSYLGTSVTGGWGDPIGPRAITNQMVSILTSVTELRPSSVTTSTNIVTSSHAFGPFLSWPGTVRQVTMAN